MSTVHLTLHEAGWRRRITAAAICALAAVFAITLAAPGLADAAKRKKKKGVVVKTMTRNLFLGSDLDPALSAVDTQGLCDGGGEVLRDVDSTLPVTRMRAVAAEIAAKKPDLVGMQEVAAWYLQTPSDGGQVKFTGEGSPATTAKYDFLKLIVDRLKALGKPYKVISVSNNFEFEVPVDYDDNPGTDEPGGICAGSESDGRMLIRDAILARVGHGVKTSKPKHGNFNQRLVLPLAGGLGFPVDRGWESVNASVRKSKPFRFVNTHLEAFDSSATGNQMCNGCTYPADPMDSVPVTRGTVRKTQAQEVLSGPAKTGLPVVLTGDLNSNVPGVQSGDSQAFQAMLSGGFKRRSTQVPASCCTDVLIGTIAEFDHVVDHILANKKRIKKIRSSVVGRAKVAGGVFPSDHAGVFSSLRIPRKRR